MTKELGCSKVTVTSYIKRMNNELKIMVPVGGMGDGLTLMNIVTKNESGKTKAVHTYIGQEGNGFACVAHSEGLDEPGVIYSYSSHVRMLKANLPYLLDCFWYNLK